MTQIEKVDSEGNVLITDPDFKIGLTVKKGTEISFMHSKTGELYEAVLEKDLLVVGGEAEDDFVVSDMKGPL